MSLFRSFFQSVHQYSNINKHFSFLDESFQLWRVLEEVQQEVETIPTYGERANMKKNSRL